MPPLESITLPSSWRWRQPVQEPSADGIFHLSYGMVELPHGRMKSREGTVVDADDLIDEMISASEQQTLAAGKAKDFSEDELQGLYEMIGIGAMKFFLLRVDPKRGWYLTRKKYRSAWIYQYVCTVCACT